VTLQLDLPPALGAQIDHLKRFFHKHYPHTELYAVGGAVRDTLLGRPVYDLDIECFGLDPETFDEAMARLGATGVGRSFFVYKYGQIDLALPRIERKTGRGHRGFSVALARTTKEASRRRDFTMNALMLRVSDGLLVDHWGGVEDIEARLIRVVDAKTFVEDSLRVLRAMQFSARLGFRIEPKSCRLMRKMALDDLSAQRIVWEFEKLFRAPYLHYGLWALGVLEIDKKIFGRTLSSSLFLSTALRMARARQAVPSEIAAYLFLYLLAEAWHLLPVTLAEALALPNRYKRFLANQKRVPKRVTDRFLGGMALRMPLKAWLGAWEPRLRERAEALGIYDNAFDPGIESKTLMARGLRGAELGTALRRAALERVRESFGRRLI